MTFKSIFTLFMMLAVVVSCTSYKSQEVSFRPPVAGDGSSSVAGALISATAYADKQIAQEAFGFDIRSAGVLPVQLVIDNAAGPQLQVVEGQTFLVDEQGGYWKLLEGRAAFKRIEESSAYGRAVKKAGRGSLFGVSAGALAGAALGVLSGENIGTATLKGAAVGGAGGAILGAGQDMGSGDSAGEIKSDLARKGLQGKPIPQGGLVSGFIFFPGEPQSASYLRLQLRQEPGGEIHNLMFSF